MAQCRKNSERIRRRGFDIGGLNTCVTPIEIGMASPIEAIFISAKEMREEYGIFVS